MTPLFWQLCHRIEPDALNTAQIDRFFATLAAANPQPQTELVYTNTFELLETGERVRFQLPTGHTIELYADKTDVAAQMVIRALNKAASRCA